MDLKQANRMMQGRGLNTLDEHIRAAQRMPQLSPTLSAASNLNLLLHQLQRRKELERSERQTPLYPRDWEPHLWDARSHRV